MSLVARTEWFGTRARVWQAIEMSDASRISDLDLRGYRGEKPGWLVRRIRCKSLAAEIRRMTLDLEPAFDGVRRLLEALQDASKLVGEIAGRAMRDAWIS